MATGIAYKDARGKWIGRIELDHPAPVGRQSGGTSYFYSLPFNIDDADVGRMVRFALPIFQKAVAFRATGGRWRFRGTSRACVLPVELAALFPHADLGFTAVECPL